MKEIRLTRGQVTLVDDDDFERFSHFKWHAYLSPSTKSFYAKRNGKRANGNRCGIFLHREILQASSGYLVDHSNHNTLDNRRENLRICTALQNTRNRLVSANNTSGFKGVCWRSRENKWQARLSANNSQKSLGYFYSPLDAARAYDAAALEYFGEFALTNEALGLLQAEP